LWEGLFFFSSKKHDNERLFFLFCFSIYIGAVTTLTAFSIDPSKGATMANFNTHISVAAAGSGLATIICTASFHLAVFDACLLCLLGIIAGLLPDIDSDHSVPIKWMFRLLTVLALLAVLIFTASLPPLYLLGSLCTTALLMHFVVFKLFKKMTIHRGLFHSVPAALLFGLLILWLGKYLLHWSLMFSWLAAAFACGGYLLHLILDELFSVDLLGGQLKDSFGSALTIFSPVSWYAYLILYAAVFTGFVLLPMPAAVTSII